MFDREGIVDRAAIVLKGDFRPGVAGEAHEAGVIDVA
jgi:hypothetical protein